MASTRRSRANADAIDASPAGGPSARRRGGCRQFNGRLITGIQTSEIQADELRTVEGSKNRGIWVFTAIDVTSRLWPVALVGRRSYRNTRTAFRDLRDRTNRDSSTFIVSDGFEYYARVVREVFGTTCLYGQALKTRRGDRVVKVERRKVMGSRDSFAQRLQAGLTKRRLALRDIFCSRISSSCSTISTMFSVVVGDRCEVFRLAA